MWPPRSSTRTSRATASRTSTSRRTRAPLPDAAGIPPMDGQRRAFVIVIDACGAGALPDAALYGDEGTNTLAHVAAMAGGLELPTLQRLGLGNVMPIDGVPPVERPVVHGRLAPLGAGKDSTAGHWELMGIRAPQLPVFPDGFPPEV